MIELTAADAPAGSGLRFRHYRGPEELPAMLRVHVAAKMKAAPRVDAFGGTSPNAQRFS